MNRIGSVIAREIREALPPFVFFLFLFHMVALTQAVALGDYRITALRATVATVGALIVAKAILLIEALPISGLFPEKRMVQVLWKTLLFAAAALAFRFVEELVPLISKHGGIAAATRALIDEVSWPLFWVAALWILGGLLLYCVASELVRAIGPARARAVFFGTPGGGPATSGT